MAKKSVIQRNLYKKPAVQEAIVEIKFNYDSFDAALPGQVFEKVKSDFPKKKNLELITLVIGASDQPNKSALPPQAPVMQAWRIDDSELVQVGPGIAVANRIKYTTWEDFLPSVRRISSAYIESASPQLVTRVGVRFINKFYISTPGVRLTDYFNIGVGIPNTLANLDGFDFTFLHRIGEKSHIKGIEFEARTKFSTDSLKTGEAGNRFMLDLDCYLASPFPPDIKQIETVATQAHDNLEILFESIITPSTRKLMGGD